MKGAGEEESRSRTGGLTEGSVARASVTPGWVPLQVMASFSKLKKLSKDVRAIAAALEGSEELVVEKKSAKQFRVRRKVGSMDDGSFLRSCRLAGPPLAVESCLEASSAFCARSPACARAAPW